MVWVVLANFDEHLVAGNLDPLSDEVFGVTGFDDQNESGASVLILYFQKYWSLEFGIGRQIDVLVGSKFFNRRFLSNIEGVLGGVSNVHEFIAQLLVVSAVYREQQLCIQNFDVALCLCKGLRHEF